MALVWFDSCNNYGTGTSLISKVFPNSEDILFATDPLNSSKNVLKFPPSYGGNTCFLEGSLTGTYNEVFGIGMDFYIDKLPEATNIGIYPLVVYGEGFLANQLFNIRINSSGFITLNGGLNYDAKISPRNWYHLEVEFKNVTSTGYVKVYLNDVLIFNQLLAVQWDPDGNGPIPSGITYPVIFRIINDPAPSSESINLYIRNIFQWNSQGSAPTTKLGNVSVADLRTDSDVSLNWTPSTGSNGYSILDNNPPNTSVNITATDTSVPAYEGNLTNLPAEVTTIHAAQVQVYTKALISSDANIQLGLKRSGSSGLGPNDVVGTTEAFYKARIDVDPSTSTAWTKTGIDAATVIIDRSN